MRRIDGHSSMGLVMLVAGVIAGGCASWSDRGTAASKSPLIPLTQDKTAAAVEFTFVPVTLPRITESESESVTESNSANELSLRESSNGEQTLAQRLQSMWQWVDETCIDPGLRSRLAENGLRIGRVTDQQRFESRLAEMKPIQDQVGTFLAKTSVATETKQGTESIQMQLGRRYELPVRQQTKGNDVAMVRLGGEIRGETVLDPQYLMAVSLVQGRASGELRLRMRPEIQHGALKQTWVGQNTALRIDSKRSVWSLEELEVDLVGGEGDMFVISALESNAGIGSQMFMGSLYDGKNQHTVLLVKLAHVPTSIDPLK